MIAGTVNIYFSHKEPEDKNLIWLRPHLEDDSFDLMYFGSKGWTKWCPKCRNNKMEESFINQEMPCGRH